MVTQGNILIIFILYYFAIFKVKSGYSALSKKCSAGNDIERKDSTTVSDCEKSCNQIPKCLAFSFNFVKKACWLKHKVKPESQYTPRPNNIFYYVDPRCKFLFMYFIFLIISKHLPSSVNNKPTNYDVRPYICIFGKRLQALYNTKYAACKAACDSKPACKGFSYHAFKHICYLHSALGTERITFNYFAYIKK